MSEVTLLFPELLLLVVPLVLLLLWRGRSSLPTTVMRGALVVLLVLVAAVPLAPRGGRGADVVVVADLSRSMPAENRARALEVVKLLEEQRRTGDRVGLVVFGREARVERLPSEAGETGAFVQQVDPDGSDLGGAIGLAASLIPPQRRGRVVVLSDGEATGASVAAAAYEAGARGVPVDFRIAGRVSTADVAVESLDLPGTVDEREPFQFSATLRTDRSTRVEAVLLREGVEIARTTKDVSPGVTPITFRDVIDQTGVVRYRLELKGPADRVPENNVGEGAIRVQAPAAILVINATGAPDNFTRALVSGKLHVRTTTPKLMPRDVASLLAYRGIVLENVSANDIGPAALTALTRFAGDLGGGLLMTGGRGSFGLGGYFKSELEPFLPVSMEIKNEHRKLSLAMVVALDRSGSMMAPVGDGRTKMDLANLGTCAAIDTLSPFDEVGVIAIDSAAHVISPLTSAEDKDAICGRTRTVTSMGGGIFTYTALVSAATMVQESDKATRHIVLFADAADAEEPGDYQRLLDRIRPLGITVSVIGLGSDADSDAAFLKDVAERGGGRVQFTTNVEELPRLFAQEAITVARSSFIDQQTAARTLSDMVLLGELPSTPFPSLDGFNLTYLKPGATMGVVTTDEHEAPVLAFWHRGLGRIASLMAEVDGRYSPRLNAWRDFSPFAVGLGRWLLGGEPPSGVQATLERRRGEGIVRVELDPDRARDQGSDTRTAMASVVAPGEGASTQRMQLRWVDDNTLEARFPVLRAGTYVGAVQLPSGGVLPLPPLSLPYSPEFEPREDVNEGRRTLEEMARISGGTERTSLDNAFTVTGSRSRRIRDLVLPLTLVVLMLHVSEIAGRRLLLFAAASEWLRSRRWARWKPARTATAPAVAQGTMASSGTPTSRPTVTAGPGDSSGDDRTPTPSTPSGETSPSSESTLARAKAKSRARLGD